MWALVDFYIAKFTHKNEIEDTHTGLAQSSRAETVSLSIQLCISPITSDCK